jgi:hypothetical protein
MDFIEGHPQNSLLCDWSMFSIADLWLQGKRKDQLVTCFRYDFTLQQAASCKHFQVKIAALGFLKRVTGSNFKIFKYGE